MKQYYILLFLLGSSLNIQAQDIAELLTKNKWLAYNDFALMNFNEDGKVYIHYAYCSNCRNNTDTLNWTITNDFLHIGNDSHKILSFNASEVKTRQNERIFLMKNLKKTKNSKLKKESIQNFLTEESPLSLKVINLKLDPTLPKAIHFEANGKMWLDQPNFRGQWAIKSFYGQLFLIYIHRHSVSRDFPLIKLTKFKNGKLEGVPMPSIVKGTPFELHISKN